jgi:hypothetical protein
VVENNLKIVNSSVKIDGILIWACPFVKTSGRAVRSRFFLNCTAFKGGAIQKKSSTAITHAEQ